MKLNLYESICDTPDLLAEYVELEKRAKDAEARLKIAERALEVAGRALVTSRVALLEARPLEEQLRVAMDALDHYKDLSWSPDDGDLGGVFDEGGPARHALAHILKLREQQFSRSVATI